MEPKIGIVTLNGYKNYGNVLQNVALQYYLKSLGFLPETIWYSGEDCTGLVNKIKFHIKYGDLIEVAKYQYLKRFNAKFKLFQKLVLRREKRFRKFCEENISYSRFRITDDVLTDSALVKEINQEYLSFLTGSDQVWGLQGSKYPEIYFLPFADKEKRNSYAASFGFANIPDDKLKPAYKEGLTNMSGISVREYEGASIVEKISKRNPTVLLDPTFLLSQSEWAGISPKNRRVNKGDYILTYFLGRKSSKWSKFIHDVAERENLQVINLNDVNSPDYFGIDPAEFLALFESAKHIVTDSFHGTVFSIIFKKKFLVIDRDDAMVNMNSRIMTLLKRMNLLDRFVFNDDYDERDLIISLNRSPDFSTADKVISDNVIESNEYLNKVTAY